MTSDSGEKSRYRLTLFVSDSSELRATFCVQEAIASLPDEDFSLTVLSVARHPELAEKHNIIATPTLVKEDLVGGVSQRLIGCNNATLVKQFLMGLRMMFEN